MLPLSLEPWVSTKYPPVDEYRERTFWARGPHIAGGKSWGNNQTVTPTSPRLRDVFALTDCLFSSRNLVEQWEVWTAGLGPDIPPLPPSLSRWTAVRLKETVVGQSSGKGAKRQGREPWKILARKGMVGVVVGANVNGMVLVHIPCYQVKPDGEIHRDLMGRRGVGGKRTGTVLSPCFVHRVQWFWGLARVYPEQLEVVEPPAWWGEQMDQGMGQWKATGAFKRDLAIGRIDFTAPRRLALYGESINWENHWVRYRTNAFEVSQPGGELPHINGYQRGGQPVHFSVTSLGDRVRIDLQRVFWMATGTMGPIRSMAIYRESDGIVDFYQNVQPLHVMDGNYLEIGGSGFLELS